MDPPHVRASAPRPGRRRPSPGVGLGTALVVVGVVLVLLGSAGISPGSAGRAGSVPATPTPAASAGPARAAPTPVPAFGSGSANCSALAAAWAVLDEVHPAAPVAPALQTPCVLDPDVAGLYFLSNAANAGDRVEFTLGLPANGSNPAAAYSAFWVGMWVTGVGCSYDDAAYLTIELIPPYATEGGITGVPWWTVEAPVWDLVPAGACDPQCSNDTVAYTIGAQGYCEDDAVTSGVGALTANGSGAFDPGDELTIALVGEAGGSTPLAVFVNDSTAPGRSIAWSYPGADTVTGQAIVPLYSSANSSDGGWTGGLNVGFGAFNCPAPTSTDSFATPCDSYDRSIAPSASPQLERVAAWNASAKGYTDLFASVESDSSTGACAGAAGIPACADFTTYGGSGTYPVFGLGAAGGRSWIAYGPPGGELAPFGNASSEFPANGNLSGPFDTTGIGAPSIQVGSDEMTVTVRATDPEGVVRVDIGSWWCTTGSSRISAVFAATESSALYNTPLDGNWSADVGTQGDHGTLYYFAEVFPLDGGTPVSPEWNETLTTGAGGACTANPPDAPVVTPGSLVPIAGGYELAWTENASSGVREFNVVANPVHGGFPTVYSFGNVTAARIEGINGTYNLTVQAIAPTGFGTNSSVTSAPATLFPLAIQPVRIRASSIWAGSVSIDLTDNVTGGAPRFTWVVDLGDGTTAYVGTVGGTMSELYTYPASFQGLAAIRVSVIDAYGDSVAAPVAFVPVQGTPLAVPVTFSGGTGFVQLRWSTPYSPSTVTGYWIFYTTEAAWAPYLTTGSLLADSTDPVHETTCASPCQIAVPDGTTVYAQILAVDAYGNGLLPGEPAIGESPYLEATASSLGGDLTAAAAGGPAPFTDQFNASFSLAPGDALTSATYRFSTGTPVPAAVASYGTDWWANASVLFPKPGFVDVYLYVTDALGQSTVLETTVYVAVGPAPLVGISVGASPAWVNSSLELTATVSDGSGSYGYAWSLGDGGTATTASVNYSYADPGDYLVTVAVTDEIWGGSASASVPLVVHPLPTVAIAQSATSSDATYRFTAVTFDAIGPITYTWLFGDGTMASGPNVTHTWPGPGNYSVTVELADTYGHTATASANSVVPSPPSASSSGGSGAASTELVGALVVLVIALAVVAAVLALRNRRRPPDAEPGSDSGAVGAPPVAPRAEESPPYR